MAAQHILKKVAPWVAGTLGLIVLVLLGLLRTAPGHAAIEWLVAKATGGEVVVVGLDGALPNHLRAARIELHDASGLWLRAERVSLDWNVLPALWNPSAGSGPDSGLAATTAEQHGVHQHDPH
jgi:autotransporter translocation and assembly factor TamB